MLRIIVCFFFLFNLTSTFAQDDYLELNYYNVEDGYDENDYRRRYPYIKGYVPSFLGLVVGYGFLKPNEIEAGLSMNLARGLIDFGLTGGYQLLYRRSLSRPQNAVDLELGIYGAVSLGIGVNYNFSNDGSALGFKPFIGTSFYHIQLLYGYNFLRKKKVEWYGLSRHNLSLRYVLPLKASKETDFYLPPAPSYYNLPGLHKDHPNNEPNSGGNGGNRRYRY